MYTYICINLWYISLSMCDKKNFNLWTCLHCFSQQIKQNIDSKNHIYVVAFLQPALRSLYFIMFNTELYMFGWIRKDIYCRKCFERKVFLIDNMWERNTLLGYYDVILSISVIFSLTTNLEMYVKLYFGMYVFPCFNAHRVNTFYSTFANVVIAKTCYFKFYTLLYPHGLFVDVCFININWITTLIGRGLFSKDSWKIKEAEENIFSFFMFLRIHIFYSFHL